MMMCLPLFFFNDTATTEIYTLSLHDALPIFHLPDRHLVVAAHLDLRPQLAEVLHEVVGERVVVIYQQNLDRKSTRLNSSHANISYAVFCLNKKTDSQPALGAGKVTMTRSEKS